MSGIIVSIQEDIINRRKAELQTIFDAYTTLRSFSISQCRSFTGQTQSGARRKFAHS